VRERIVRGRRALALVVLSAVLAIGALSELVGWAAALRFGHLAAVEAR
jgi:uncharacterized membrane protein YjdF